MAALLLYLIIVLRNNHLRTERIISFISVMLCISFVYSMIKLYMIPSVISWNNPFTPVSFIITTFLCGLILLAVIIWKNFDGFNYIIALLTAILVICSLANSILFYGTFLKQVYYLFIIRTALSIISLLIITVLNFRFQSNKTGIWWVILSLIVVVSEIINRYIFFLSFEKSGL